MKKSPPLVSVIIPSFNYDSYLRDALNSVLGQSYQNFEIIVVDDGSSDSSPEIIFGYAKRSSNIKVYFHQDRRNLGLPETLKLGISKASGEWLAFLEADDIWNPFCLEKRIEAVKNTNVAFCCNAIAPIIESHASDIWFKSYVPRVQRKLVEIQKKNGIFDLQDLILEENYIPTFSCVMVKKQILESCDFASPVNAWLDWYLWSQVFQKTKGVFIELPLTQWRLHSDSQNSRKTLTGFLRNYAHFRRRLSDKFLSTQIENKERKIRRLREPVLLPLTRRCILGIQEVGFLRFFQQVLKRFQKI